MTAARTLPYAAPISITYETVKVNPATAERWLGKNVRNRHVSSPIVARYAAAMKAGEWLLNGEAIKFAANGDLLDGQHRLLALIESGKTISFLVVRGLPTVAQNVLDTGRARTTGDQLGIAGFVDPNALAAAAKLAIMYEAGNLGSSTRGRSVSTPQVLEFVNGNVLLGHATTRARTVSKGCGLRPAVAAMCFYELMKVDDQAAQVFFDRLGDGVELPAGSPILALRARLRSLVDERATLPPAALTSLVMRAWNAWREGRRVSNFPIYRDGVVVACPVPK